MDRFAEQAVSSTPHSAGIFGAVRDHWRTIELKRRIRESAARGAANPRTRRVLIAEPGPPSWPERVFGDPVLEPVDKIVWMVLRQSAIRGRFPSYGQIGRAASVSSNSTVSRSIAILRATRWLARCVVRVTRGTGRDTNGGPRGTGLDADDGPRIIVYALHENPLPVQETRRLDASYLDFLKFAQAHPHARVRKVVKDILESL